MVRTALFKCPIKGEIRAVDSQSVLRILLCLVKVKKALQKQSTNNLAQPRIQKDRDQSK